jgi:hypothetical protein
LIFYESFEYWFSFSCSVASKFFHAKITKVFEILITSRGLEYHVQFKVCCIQEQSSKVSNNTGMSKIHFTKQSFHQKATLNFRLKKNEEKKKTTIWRRIFFKDLKTFIIYWFICHFTCIDIILFYPISML